MFGLQDTCDGGESVRVGLHDAPIGALAWSFRLLLPLLHTPYVQDGGRGRVDVRKQEKETLLECEDRRRKVCSRASERGGYYDGGLRARAHRYVGGKLTIKLASRCTVRWP
jgi:hypothetical protein